LPGFCPVVVGVVGVVVGGVVVGGGGGVGVVRGGGYGGTGTGPYWARLAEFGRWIFADWSSFTAEALLVFDFELVDDA
jgi:hypothetical protein